MSEAASGPGLVVFMIETHILAPARDGSTSIREFIIALGASAAVQYRHIEENWEQLEFRPILLNIRSKLNTVHRRKKKAQND